MTSIHDVAALAKVSIKTVSRVVNKAPNVSEELRARVQAAIEQLGYRPNQSARRLAGGRSFMIAFLYNNPAPGYVSRIQMGAAWRCRDLGYHLVVEPLSPGGEERFDVLDRLVAALRPCWCRRWPTTRRYSTGWRRCSCPARASPAPPPRPASPYRPPNRRRGGWWRII